MDANDLAGKIRLADGRTLVLRPLRVEDLAALRHAFQRLTPREIELRFLLRPRELPDFDVVRAIHALIPAGARC